MCRTRGLPAKALADGHVYHELVSMMAFDGGFRGREIEIEAVGGIMKDPT